jgi:hypothetical protein
MLESAKPAAASPNGVAPSNNGFLSFVSTGVIQTCSPLFYLDKNRNALAVSAGFKIFIPVPPKNLPSITAK